MTTVQDLIDALNELNPELPVGVFMAAQRHGTIRYEVLGVDMAALTRYTDDGPATAWIVANHLDEQTNDARHLWSSRPRTWPVKHDLCHCHIETTVVPGQALSLDAAHHCNSHDAPEPIVLGTSTLLHPDDTRDFNHNQQTLGIYQTD